jgi:Ulp1 family protease
MNQILGRMDMFMTTLPADGLNRVIRWWRKWDGEETKCFVLNTSPRSVHWGHWLLLTFFKGKERIEVFDSLGSPALIPGNIRSQLEKIGMILFTETPIQELTSNFCGIYVLARAQSIDKGETLKYFYKKFNLDNLDSNDVTCLNMVLHDLH